MTRVGRAVELSPADADVACQREFGRPARTMEEKLAFAYELAER